MDCILDRSKKMVKRRSRYEVFALKNYTKKTYHNKLLNAKKSKSNMLKKGAKGVIIYDIKLDKLTKY